MTAEQQIYRDEKDYQKKAFQKPRGGPLIQLEESDQAEIEQHALKTVQEEGQRESSDEGDGDDGEDPDDDLDF